MTSARVEKAVRHYQKDIEHPGQPEARVLYCIEKLYRLPVTVQHLQDTGVGRTVNALRKGDGDVASAARALVTKWKQMVAEEEDAQEYQQNNEHNDQEEEEEDDDDDDEDEEEEEEESNKKPPSPEPVRISEERRKKEKYYSENDNRIEKHKREYEDEDAYQKYKEQKKRKREELDQYEYSKNYQSHDYDENDHNNRQNSAKKQERNHMPESPETLQNSEPEFHIDEPNLSDSEDEQEKQIQNHKPATPNEIEKYSQSSSKESSKSHSKHRSSSSSKNSSSKHDEKKSKHKSEEKSEHKRSRDKSKDHSDSKKSKHSHEKEPSQDHKESDRENKKKSKHHDEKHNDKKKEKHSDDKQRSDREREKSDKHKEHKNKNSSQRSSSSSKSKPSTSEHKPKKHIEASEDGIGCESGASFAEALGMINPGKSTSSSKKKSSHSSSNHSSSSKSRSNGDTPTKKEKSSKKEQDPATLSLQSKLATQSSSLLVPDMKLTPLPPLTVSISALPEISPHYVPRPAPRLMDSIVPNISEEEALSVVMNTKNQRTKVFSGNRVIHGSIPSLYELCCYVLQENIDALEYTGGVPYDLLKPVIEKATPNQLFNLENYNPYLIEDTDELWQLHCQKSFRMQKRQEMESWRDMYMRCTDEQEAKLKSLTANIKLAQDKCLPVRQTKMAYVDSVVKPPRNIARKQAIYGTARKPVVSPAARVASLAGNNVVKGTEVKGASSSSGHAPRSTGFIKPKKAPLMQKALQLIKGRYKR